ncbi:MAG: ABC transporter permease, partial [Actinomycetota bacterium]|nr:ABC transporter permease [Actinomycetota bacterium]
RLAKYYNLNGSLPSQFGHYLNRLVHGDLGRSITTNQPVTHEVSKAIPWTVLLITTSMLLSAAIGLVLGVQAGWRRDKPADRALMTGLLTVREFPPYLLASLLLFFVAVKLGWLPVGGAETPFSSSFSLFHRVTDIARHAALPVLVLTCGLVVSFYLVMRSGMVNELGSDYLLMGRAKGLRNRRLKYRYAARNALLPVVSLSAVEIGFAVTANIFVEQVFSYPGLGGLMIGSVRTYDYPVMQGAFLVFSVGIVTVNALADLAYRRLDPRATA